MSERIRKVIISGGGTGGHVFPAIAIADALKEEMGEKVDILFVGAKGKIEMEKVPKAGYPIEGLWISGLHRKLTMRNLLFPVKLVSSLIKARSIIHRFRPDVAVGVGGFASGPLLDMASRMHIPCLIQEQNSYAGLTNRLLAAKVYKICVAYDHMDRYFPAEKIVWTGNPVRKDLGKNAATKAEGLAHFGLQPGKPVIFVFGGSLGAQAINEAMAANAAFLREHPDVQVLWQAGKLYYDRFRTSETAQLPNVVIQPFIDRMDLAYAMADLVVCRAGALTIAELSILGQPAVLIPSPNVAEDHQTKNAMALVEKNAAVVVKNEEASDLIMRRAFEILQDQEQLDSLRDNILQLARPDAAQRIAREILNLIEQTRT